MTDKVPDRTDLHAYIFPCYYVYINLCRYRNMFLCTQLHIPLDSYENAVSACFHAGGAQALPA